MSTFGPDKTSSSKLSPPLLKFIDSCTKYISNLTDFNKYCVWRYTIGSASINTRLIFNKPSENSPRWTYLFFLYHKNTYPTNRKVPRDFYQWQSFFDKPDSYNQLPLDKQLLIANKLIDSYTILLNKIILDGPKTPKGDNIHVYKVASKYPQLPDIVGNKLVPVKQLPFNSVTVIKNFNFAPFIPADASCCLFDISLPPGSICLYIPTDYHAYPFEHEIILPPESTFLVKSIDKQILNYIDKEKINIVTLQSYNKIQLGPVYTINEFYPCKGNCESVQKFFTVYSCIYKNP